VGTTHTVAQGEHLSGIAQQYGFNEYRTIWDHPQNSSLKEQRRNPNVLFPGDSLFIPDKQAKTEPRGAGQQHSFKVSRPTIRLRLALRDFDNQPLANTDCEIRVDGTSTALTTDADGRFEVPVAATATEATLVFKDPLVPFDLTVPIKIGHLDPVDQVSGQKARLSNLGYITRPLEEVDDTVFAHTVQEFQCDLDLPVTGECDDATQAKLKELHGS